MAGDESVESRIAVLTNWGFLGAFGVGFVLSGFRSDSYLLGLLGFALLAAAFVAHLIINRIYAIEFAEGEIAAAFAIFGLAFAWLRGELAVHAEFRQHPGGARSHGLGAHGGGLLRLCGDAPRPQGLVLHVSHQAAGPLMSQTLIWLVAAIALYMAFCLYCGVATARSAADSKRFFLADRNVPAWAFVLTGTLASFSAWVFLGQGEMVAREGLPFAETAFGAITIPLAGVLFMKRQWMLAKRFGYVTPAEMLGDYFESEAIRVLVLILALLFAVPFMGLQLAATARLIGTLSD